MCGTKCLELFLYSTPPRFIAVIFFFYLRSLNQHFCFSFEHYLIFLLIHVSLERTTLTFTHTRHSFEYLQESVGRGIHLPTDSPPARKGRQPTDNQKKTTNNSPQKGTTFSPSAWFGLRQKTPETTNNDVIYTSPE